MLLRHETSGIFAQRQWWYRAFYFNFIVVAQSFMLRGDELPLQVREVESEVLIPVEKASFPWVARLASKVGAKRVTNPPAEASAWRGFRIVMRISE